MGLWNVRLLRVLYTPRPEEKPFLQRAAVQSDDEFTITLSVLDDRESERFFGVPLARRGIQPVWLQIANHGSQPYRLRLARLDPGYYTPLEAAMVNHFAIGTRLLGFGLMAWFFLPVLLLLPFKLLGAWAANRRMNAFFQEHGIGSTHPARTRTCRLCLHRTTRNETGCIQLVGSGGVKEFSLDPDSRSQGGLSPQAL
jgi:hypothetical protein